MSAMERIVLGMVQSATYEAMCAGRCGIGGCSEWRDAAFVFYALSDRLWRLP